MFKIVYDEKQVSVELSSFESRWRQCDEHWAHTAKHQMEHHSTAHHHHHCRRRYQPPITVHLNGMTMFSSINNGCAHKSIRQLQKRVNRPNDKCFSAHGKNYRKITSASLEIGISEIWEQIIWWEIVGTSEIVIATLLTNCKQLPFCCLVLFSLRFNVR